MDQKADVEKLLQEKQQLITCIEELELEAARNYRVLTEELRTLKAANKELKGKYEFSESHYQMTLRHANNLQSFLDARDQELTHLRGQEKELQEKQQLELSGLQEQLERANQMLKHREDELTQTQRHANNLQKMVGDLTTMQEKQRAELLVLRQHLERGNQMLKLREDELMQARRHADNLQQMLNAGEQHGGLRSKLHRIKERVQRWFR